MIRNRHHPIRRTSRAAAWIAVLLLAGAASAVACPQSQLQLCFSQGRFSAEAHDSLEAALGDCVGQVGYDLPLGRFSFRMGVDAAGSASGALVLADGFAIHGPAKGEPVECTMELAMTLIGAGGSGMAGSMEAAGGRTDFTEVADDRREIVVTVPIRVPAGASFPVSIRMDFSAADGHVEAWGRYRFVGLPDGAVAISCQGFRSDRETPIVPSTWGRLRLRYR